MKRPPSRSTPWPRPLSLSDKSDVRRSRVRKDAVLANDIHDRVNFAVVDTKLEIQPENKACIFHITIDTQICPVMEYFEIFLDRMILCRKAAQTLGLQFELIINNTPAAVTSRPFRCKKLPFQKRRQLFCACKMRRKPPLAWAGGGFFAVLRMVGHTPWGTDHHFDGLAAHLHGDGLGQLVQVEPVGDDGGEIQLAGVNQPARPARGCPGSRRSPGWSALSCTRRRGAGRRWRPPWAR